MRALLVLFVLVIVNLPAAHEAWVDHELDGKGRDLSATVVDARSDGGHNLVDYRLPRSADPDRAVFSASLTDDAYAVAKETGRLDVRMLPGEPGSNRPEGEVDNPLFLVVAITGDVILAVVGYLLWRRLKAKYVRDPGHETLQP